jgi:hypothetical protein
MPGHIKLGKPGEPDPGTDLMKLDFGRKLFGQIFILEF